MTSMCIYMTTQQSGMQQTQQSHPPQSQSRHLVLPGAVPTGLIIELVAEPGRTKLTGSEVELVHMSFEGNEGRQRLGSGPFRRLSEMLNCSLNSAQDTYLVLSIYMETERSRFRRDCAAGRWALGTGRSSVRQDAMTLNLCTLTRRRKALKKQVGKRQGFHGSWLVRLTHHGKTEAMESMKVCCVGHNNGTRGTRLVPLPQIIRDCHIGARMVALLLSYSIQCRFESNYGISLN